MDLHRKQQQEVMEISSEEEEKKTETSLSSNEIRVVCKSKCHWIGALLKSHKKKKSQQIAVIPLVTMKVVLPNNK
jgi:hypothetical protein